jgi:hypothetical protein
LRLYQGIIGNLRKNEILAPDLSDSKFMGKQKAPKGVSDPLEASYCHLLKTPPSHFRLRKVRDSVARFFVNEG